MAMSKDCSHATIENKVGNVIVTLQRLPLHQNIGTLQVHQLIVSGKFQGTICCVLINEHPAKLILIEFYGLHTIIDKDIMCLCEFDQAMASV